MFLLCYTSPIGLNEKLFSRYAVMAELADAHGSGPCARKGMEVRVLLAAPKKKRCSFESISFFVRKPEKSDFSEFGRKTADGGIFSPEKSVYNGIET